MSCSSGKVIYFSRTRAKTASKVIKKAGKGNRLCDKAYNTLRPYKCRECMMFHLTSKSKL